MAKTVKKASAQPKAATKPKNTSSDKKSTATAVTATPIDPNEVAKLAHQLWVERGHRHGHHEEDWIRAEQMLLGKAS